MLELGNAKLAILAIMVLLALAGAACEDEPGGHQTHTQCLICHADGVGNAPRVRAVPDHSTLADDRAVCLSCRFQD